MKCAAKVRDVDGREQGNEWGLKGNEELGKGTNGWRKQGNWSMVESWRNGCTLGQCAQGREQEGVGITSNWTIHWVVSCLTLTMEEAKDKGQPGNGMVSNQNIVQTLADRAQVFSNKVTELMVGLTDVKEVRSAGT